MRSGGRFFLLVLVAVVGLLASAAPGQETQLPELQLRKSLPVRVSEPSGLALDVSGQFLWTVSDSNNRVYKISLQGEVLDSLRFVGDDLEGVTVNPLTGTVFVVEERRRELVELDSLGNELRRAKIPVKQKKKNQGLEGVTCDPETGLLYVVNQKKPKRLVQLSQELLARAHSKLTFAKDYSGLDFDRDTGLLWVLSDASHTVTTCDLSGKPERSFRHEVKNAEGIAVDKKRGLLYLVSDSESELYVFTLPD